MSRRQTKEPGWNQISFLIHPAAVRPLQASGGLAWSLSLRPRCGRKGVEGNDFLALPNRILFFKKNRSVEILFLMHLT